MESIRISRNNSRAGEQQSYFLVVIYIFYFLFILAADVLLSDFALVEFEEEECTAVVPFNVFSAIRLI